MGARLHDLDASAPVRPAVRRPHPSVRPSVRSKYGRWALLNYLYPTLFTKSADFDSAFKLSTGGMQADDAKLAAAAKLLRPLMLRRVKSEVEARLPPRLETSISCPLSEMQVGART